ncbi:hypothetical protein ACFCV8_01890 [Streptomyces sp. NPDC056347]
MQARNFESISPDVGAYRIRLEVLAETGGWMTPWTRYLRLVDPGRVS